MESLLFPEEGPGSNALSLVLQRLSVNWKVAQQRPRAYVRRRWVPDLILKLRGPQSGQWRIIVSSGEQIAPADVPALAEKMHACAQKLGGNVIPLVTADFFGRRIRELLVKEDLSYADSTGNLRINGHHPLLLFEVVGANSDPACRKDAPHERP